jgi:tetratricopeptide (TPR) repeat protein
VVRSEDAARARAAAVVAALIAFMVSAAFDWVWQLPVLPVAFLMLAAAVLAPASKRVLVRLRASEDADRTATRQPRPHRILVRAGLAVAALACLAAIGVPLATTTAVRQSQAAIDAGNTSSALVDVRSAARLEPGAASPQLQLALVLELEHHYPAAIAAVQRAIVNEPQNWSEWLVLSRLQAETGQVKASVASYQQARALNPQSSLFRQ